MRFPLPLTAKIAAYVIGHKLRGTKKFALVLQLEPLHTCNLTCTGCGRIREYSTSLKDMMSLEDCLAAANECSAPMVSICGGEPLIYPYIEALVEGLLAQKRIVYICTNAMFMRKKMREWLASEYRKADTGQRTHLEEKIQALQSKGLVSEKDAAEIRKGPKDPAKPTIAPSKWMYWNVHQDGETPWLSGCDQHDGLQGNRHAGDRTHVRLYFRPRRRWSYHHTGLRLRRCKARHDQTPQFIARKLLPHARHDDSEVPESRRVDEAIHVFGNACLF